MYLWKQAKRQEKEPSMAVLQTLFMKYGWEQMLRYFGHVKHILGVGQERNQ